LNLLELEFLAINNYNIYISLEELQQYGDQLLMHSIRETEKTSSAYNLIEKKRSSFDIKYKNNELLYPSPWDK
jgi:hypothetical protein